MKIKFIFIFAFSLIVAAVYSGTVSAEQLATGYLTQNPRNIIGQVVIHQDRSFRHREER